MTTQLRTAIDATADALTADPGAARRQLTVTSRLVGPCAVEARAGEHVVVIDQPAGLGEDRAPNPAEYGLVALAACQAQTYRFWAEKLGIALDDVTVEVRGEVDVRRLFGVDGGRRAGFARVEVAVYVRGPADPGRYAALREAADAHCPLLDTFAREVPVTTSVVVG